jgi:hypothetical protein
MSKLYWPSDRRLSAKLMPTFEDRGCNVVSVTDPYGCILGFLARRPRNLVYLNCNVTVPNCETSPTWRALPCLYSPGAGFPYRLLLRLAGLPLRWRYSTRLHTGPLLDKPKTRQSFVTTDGQSVSLSWFQAPIWGSWLIFFFSSSLIMYKQLRFSWCGRHSDERTGL